MKTTGNKEDPFEVAVTTEGSTYTYSVYPEWDIEGSESLFVIGIDSDDIGTLRMNADTNLWEWIEGGLGDDMASSIGNEINHHYD